MKRGMQEKSEQRVALVTGSSRGIGRAIVERLAEDGFTVIANVHSMTAEAKRLERTYVSQGKSISIVQADVADETQVKAMIRNVAARFGRLDVVVNSAGIIYNKHDETISSITRARLEEYFSVNVNGGIYVTRHAIPLLKKSHCGRVIYINTALSFVGTGRRFGYTISKTTNIGVVRALALECAPHRITVNAIVPGYIRTRMAHFPGKELIAKIARIPLRHLGEPTDVAHAVSFLATKGASYITGQHIHVNGGLFFS